MKNKSGGSDSISERKIKIDLSWKAWSLIVGFIILLGIVGFGYAQLGDVPPMGHSVNELQKCGANEILKMDSTGTSWSCQSASSGTLSCVRKKVYVQEGDTAYTLQCDPGYLMTGTSIICGNGNDNTWIPQGGGVLVDSLSSARGVCVGSGDNNDVQWFSIFCCKTN